MSESEPLPPTAIAIVGMACRLPGAETVSQFWANLRAGVESVTFFSADKLAEAGVPASLLTDPHYVRANARLAGIEQFDAAFFGMTPREAEITDPQHRLFLECAWEALEAAGYATGQGAGSVGVFGGAGMSTYLVHNLLANRERLEVSDFQLLMGNNKDFVPTRVSYKLNLTGPSINVNSACSTSLVAVHLACQSLLDYSCDMALAGGVGIQVPQERGYLYEAGGIVSPDGHCRPFDAQAQGTINGSGAGVVVLKRLADALADGDTLQAVILGSAINNDGMAKVGFTAPSVEGQAQVIAQALALAEVEPDSLQFVEAHGTATALGDPIEVRALTQVFQARTARRGFCALGSVKGNFGHLDEAAGVAGLIKSVLALHHREIPPTLHFTAPNPALKLEGSPFYVNGTLLPWPATSGPRRVGISSFGIGGTNAHVVVQEAPAPEPSGPARPTHLLPLSAQTEAALAESAARLAEHLDAHPDLPLADVAYTLSVGRKAFKHRRVVLCRDYDEARAALRGPAPAQPQRGLDDSLSPTVAFLFPGQGAQHVGMAAGLYRHEPRFRQTLEACSDILQPHLGLSLLSLLHPPAGQAAERRLSETAYTQPALFAIEYALAMLWQKWGVVPQAMLGHSLGEYVAACLAGVFSLEDALALVAARGALMQGLPTGAMLAVPLSEEAVQPWLDTDLSLAAVNGLARCVLSGPHEAVAETERRLAEAGIGSRRLETSHAFHSAMMEPILEPFRERVRQVRRQPPRQPYLSNVTGSWITAAETTDPAYWATHLRQTVRFADGLAALFADPARLLLEVGPGRTLTTFAAAHSGKRGSHLLLTSTPHAREATGEDEEHAFLLRTLGTLWTAGVPVAWQQFYEGEQRQRRPLPTYPFQRQRYWVDAPRGDAPVPALSALPARRPEVAEWFYSPSWRRVPLPPSADSPSGSWLLLTDGAGVGRGLAARLTRAGHTVVTVEPGAAFAALEPGRFQLDPSQPADYGTLVATLHQQGRTPTQIVHLWGITPDGAANFEAAQWLGFYSVLFLAQALAARDLLTGRLGVISAGVQDVTGEERLAPEKATVLGLVKVLQQEFSDLQTQHIDITVPLSPRLAALLYEELLSPTVTPSVAYRGGHRWVQTFEPCPLAEPTSETDRLRPGGRYLITGGLGGVGMIVAEFLARTLQARLLLVGRSPLPPHAEANGSDPARAAVRGAALLRERELAVPALRGIQAYPGVEATFNELASRHIVAYFTSRGVSVTKGGQTTVAALRQRLGLLPEFHKFLDFFLHVLTEDGIARRADEQVAFLRGADEVGAPAALLEEALARYPEFRGMLTLVDHCAHQYGPALSGEIAAISVLYPDGAATLLEEAGRDTVPHSYRALCTTLLEEVVAQRVAAAAGRTVRILEIGAGDGLMTRTLAPALRGKGVEYTVTDLGRSFVRTLEQQAQEAGLDFMRFGVLDIAADPVAQGYAAQSYDLILGLDVVHATPHIATTLRNLQTLLAPDGTLALVESVRQQRWIDMIWGLAKGWWYFDDAPLRHLSPLLERAGWEEVLRAVGFGTVSAFPQREAQGVEYDYNLLLAQGGSVADSDLTQRRIEAIRRCERWGAEVRVASADVADERQMAALFTEADERWGGLDGVIHAAGVTSGETIFNLLPQVTPQQAQALFHPKVEGVYVLDRLLRERTLDFCLLVSSNAAVLGGVGLSAYAAASLFLDAFAIRQTRASPFPWISTNWDSWPTEEFWGQQVRVQTSIDRYGMSRTEAEQAFLRAVNGGGGQVIVSAGDLQARLRQWSQPHHPSPEERGQPSGAVSPIGSLHGRPPLVTEYVAPRTEVEAALVSLWEEVLGITPIGIQDNFFELQGDSLLGTQVIARVRRRLEVELPLATLFEEPTIVAQAERIERLRWSAEALRVRPSEALDEEEEEGEL